MKKPPSIDILMQYQKKPVFEDDDALVRAIQAVFPDADHEELLSNLADVKKWTDAEAERQRRNKELPYEELNALSDDDLDEAVWNRTDEKVEQAETDLAGVAALPHAARVFYVVHWYAFEVYDGGLCQYFVNSSRKLAPMLSDCLEEIAALDHKALFDGFVQKNGIDVNDLSSFVSHSVEEYVSQTKRYPFEDFDAAFSKLPLLSIYLTPYVRANISVF